MATISASLTAHAGNAETGGKYAFDGKISREVLENYLARSLHMLGLADSKQFDEDLRMIKNVGAKQIGRVAGIWWSGDVKVDVEAHFARAKTAADVVSSRRSGRTRKSRPAPITCHAGQRPGCG